MKTIWLNLPVKNLEKSKQFYKNIGFRENPMHKEANHIGSFLVGEKDFVLMLFPEKEISNYTALPVNDTSTSSQMLINLDAESKNEIDEFAKKVTNAGGTVYFTPTEVDGWMYIISFADIDGHRWSMLHMDIGKLSKK